MGLSPDYTAVLVESLDDALDLRSWLGERRSGGWLGVDTETTGINLGKDKIRLFQVGDLAKGWAVPWEDWRGLVKDLLKTYDRPLVLHNAAFDLAMLKKSEIVLREELVDDTMVMAHLVNPVGRIGLKPLAAKLVGAEAMLGKDNLSDTFHSGGWDWATIPIDHPDYWIYSVLDTSLTVGVAEALWPDVRDKYRRVYEVEMGAIHVLRDARIAGLCVDMDYTHLTRAQLLNEMERVRRDIPVSPSKDREVRAMFEQLGVERGYGPTLGSWWPFRTETGEVSVDKDALTYFESHFPDLIPPLRTWRTNNKLVTSYMDNIIKNNASGKVHCNVQPLAARTGRMSITDPALQTLPRGTVVRDAFVASEGCKLVMADYAQLEARVFASFAKCEPMIQAFKQGIDMHSWTAAMCYTNGDMQLVTKPQRVIAKGVGFAKLYGAGNDKIAATAGVPIEEIEKFMSIYNERFPEVPQFIQSTINSVMYQWHEEGQGYVTTILGRRLPVDRDKPYVGVNYLVQSSSTSDLLKLKICELDAAGIGKYLRLPVHDELIFDVPDEDIDDVLDTIHEVMPEKDLFSTPLEIESDVAVRWGDHYREPADRPWTFKRREEAIY